MLLREEFANTIGYISECVDTVIVTAQDMIDSKDLQELLYLVLITGNFLNSVSLNSGGLSAFFLQNFVDISFYC